MNCEVYLGLLARIELAPLSRVAAEAVVFSCELVIVVSIEADEVVLAVGLGNVGTNLELPIVLDLDRCMRYGMRVLVQDYTFNHACGLGGRAKPANEGRVKTGQRGMHSGH